MIAIVNMRIVACLIVSALLGFCVGSAHAEDQQAKPAPTPSDMSTRTIDRHKTYMKRRWGIEVVWVRQTSAGYMLEFRYKVIDAEKAKALFVRQTKPVLIHEASGAEMIVPTPAKTGALRNTDVPQEGRTYWMFFANPGKFVKPGDLISIQIGEYLQEHLRVQ